MMPTLSVIAPPGSRARGEVRGICARRGVPVSYVQPLEGRAMAIKRDYTLDAKYRQEEGVIFLSGIQALVRLPLDQHRADKRRGLNTATLISGYRGSPLRGAPPPPQRNPDPPPPPPRLLLS